MARGLALGWRQPVLCTDVDAARARALADEVGGEAVAVERRGRRSAPISSCSATSPPSSSRSPLEVAPHAKAVVSILGGTPLATSRPPTPTAPCTASCPARRSRCARAPSSSPPTTTSGQPILDARVRELFAELGTLVVARRRGSIDVAMGLMSNAPAYYALVAEAQVDAGVRRGIPPRPGRGARRRRRWPAPPSCCAAASTTRSPCAAAVTSPGGVDRRAASTRSSAAGCARRSRTRWTRS